MENNNEFELEIENEELDVPARISFFRNLAGLSGPKLSARLGKSKLYINKLESNEFKPSYLQICRICDECGITLAEFFADDYQNYRTNMKLFQLIQNIPIAEREKLIDLLSVAFPPKDSKK